MEPTGTQNGQENEALLDTALAILHNERATDRGTVQNSVLALADASRSNAALRNRLATPRSLHALLDILCTSLSDQFCRSVLVTSALRCIGNACIDNDEARAVVIQAPNSSLLNAYLVHNDGDVVRTFLKVIYNLCVDYEPAQKWGWENDIDQDLILLLSDGKPSERCIDLNEDGCKLALDLLFWFTNQRPAAAANSPITTGIMEDSVSTTSRSVLPGILHRLLRLPYLYAQEVDPEDYATMLEICLTYLRDPEVQQQVHEHQLVQYVWRMLWDNEKRLQKLEPKASHGQSEAEEVKMLIPLSSSLTWCLSDIAATRTATSEPNGGIEFKDDFLNGLAELIVYFGANKKTQAESKQLLQRGAGMTWQGRMVAIYPIPDHIISLPDERQEAETQALQGSRPADEDFVIPEGPRCIVAACQFLANALWRKELQPNTETWISKRLYASLWSAIVETQDAELLHSAAGLLTQLSRCSVEYREAMAIDDKAMPALERLCASSTPQIKQDGAKLLKALGRDSAVNRARFSALAQRVLDSMVGTTSTAAALNTT